MKGMSALGAQVTQEASGLGHCATGRLRFVDNRGKVTEIYPLNPSGSPQGIAGVTTPDGRFTILMPHPERGFRAAQHSWHPGWQRGCALDADVQERAQMGGVSAHAEAIRDGGRVRLR